MGETQSTCVQAPAIPRVGYKRMADDILHMLRSNLDALSHYPDLPIDIAATHRSLNMAFKSIHEDNFESARHHLAAASDRVRDLKSFDEKDVVSRALAQSIIRTISTSQQNLIDNLKAAKDSNDKICDFCGQPLPKNCIALQYHMERHFEKPMTVEEVRKKNQEYIDRYSKPRRRYRKQKVYRSVTAQKENTPTTAALNPIESQVNNDQESESEGSEMEWTAKDEQQADAYDSCGNLI